jgi:hypothetical protein
MGGRRWARWAGAAALVAAAAPLARAQTFVTSLAGLGGTPVGLTPIGASGTSTMSVNWLTSTDPLVRLAASREGCMFSEHPPCAGVWQLDACAPRALRCRRGCQVGWLWAAARRRVWWDKRRRSPPLPPLAPKRLKARRWRAAAPCADKAHAR